MLIEKIKSANGIISVPGDKSISHRAVMLGAVADGDTHIRRFLSGADCLATIDCFRKMGIEIDMSGDELVVHGKGIAGLRRPAQTLYTANSGTTTRLLCGLLAGQGFDCVITGDESIQRRPMRRVTRPLSLMGAKIEGEFCPLSIHGALLKGIDYKMEVASAQVKTAILLAGLYADGETTVHETEKSRNHTEIMLAAMGAPIKESGKSVTVSRADRLRAQDITVCADISSAAFFMALGTLIPNSELTITGVGINETRTGIIDVMQEMNANIKIENIRYESGEPVADITVRSSSLKGCTVGGGIIPRLIDEIPVIAVMAAFADGETVIRDAAELKVKESNRIKAIVTELKRCGADIMETEDGMIIRGGRQLRGAEFESYGDHRMAMSLAVLAQLADGESYIDNADCVSVSFPEFFGIMKSLG